MNDKLERQVSTTLTMQECLAKERDQLRAELAAIKAQEQIGEIYDVDGVYMAIWAELLAAAPKPPVQQCEAPSCGCADAYCKAWDEAPQPSDDAKDAGEDHA